MNKKKYTRPGFCVAELDMEALVAESIQAMRLELDQTVESMDEVWTKENKSLWDSEW